MNSKSYLEYLDKEMTIMGILSAVSAVAPGGVLNALFGDKSDLKSALWNGGSAFILAGSALCLTGAFCFYQQRSRLAWYYGQICLMEILNDAEAASEKVRELCTNADSWETWIRHRFGLTFLVAGFFGYFLALLFLVLAGHSSQLDARLRTVKAVVFVVWLVLTAIAAVVHRYVFKKYKFQDHPWLDFFSDIRHAFRKDHP